MNFPGTGSGASPMGAGPSVPAGMSEQEAAMVKSVGELAMATELFHN